MVMLAKRFATLDDFSRGEGASYRLLPFRFIALDSSRYVLTNLVGEYSVLTRNVVEDLVRHRLTVGSAIYDNLKAMHFLVDDDSTVAHELLGLKYRSKLSRVAQFTGLHMFVVTLRCETSCVYCQVSRQTEDKAAFDMSEETAARAVDFTFASPSRSIKIEFQGGEPLLHFDRVQSIVKMAKDRNVVEKRNLSFVIATNLALLSDEVLNYADRENIFISTSLDGPEDLHNKNRPRKGKNSYQLATSGIRRVQERLGRDSVSALMTTSHASLKRVKEIIDEYVKLGLREIFLRPLSPYGFAAKGGHSERYNADEWLEFYREGLEYILELNKHGYSMKEVYSCLVLQKMLSPQNPGYVDLQSPAGIGIGGIIYNYDGSVYASDESRMLAESDDKSFRLGSLATESYDAILGSDVLLDALESSLAESAPMCSDCAFVPYCGADPVYHHQTQGDVVGNKSLSGFCHRNMEIFRHLILKMEDSPADRAILQSWIRP